MSLILSLFISARKMAHEKTDRDLQTSDGQLKEMFLSLSKGKGELKTLIVGTMTKKNPDNDKDGQLEQLQAEMETMRIQMISQMALIQNLARGQEELRIRINKLHQGKCNRIEKTFM